MRRFGVAGSVALAALLASGASHGAQQPRLPPRYEFGRPATAEDIRAWSIEVMPDGRGLPAGRGTAADGATTYARSCAACHGATGVEGPFMPLVGREPREGFPFGRDPVARRTVGNYWPYATTLFDYLRRAMPLDAPGSLAADDVYGLVAYLLWRNEIIADTAAMDAASLPRVVMPARGRFVSDEAVMGATSGPGRRP
jgi:cytochrome c